MLRTFYPEIEPYVTGTLQVGDGHELYWEISGNPEGKPVVFLHGGPGGASRPTYRQLFNPDAYRIIMFDQRNCGKSRPHAMAADIDFTTNTTPHLVEDVERLRTHLGIEKWMVFGGSWGVTLGLAYAEMFPHRVSEMVFRGIFTAREEELRWIFQDGANRIFPDRWEEFVAPLTPEERQDTLRSYSRLLSHPDDGIRLRAAAAWSTWEGVILTLLPNPDLVAGFAEPEFSAAIARIENHFFNNGAFLEEGQLIRDAGKLDGIPCVLIQGRYDAVCPARTAWDLHLAVPGSELILVEDAGHAYDEPGILHHTILTTDRFAGLTNGVADA